MDYAKEIRELKEKILQNQKPDFANGELYHREVQQELTMKRDQVVQLKKEIHTMNAKLFEQNRELESCKSQLKESEFNLKLALKKAASIETIYKETNENYMNLKLKEEMRQAEIQILQSNIQKVSRENLQLLTEINDLRDKWTYSRAFQNELENRQTKINAVSAKIKEGIDNAEKEHARIVEIKEKMEKNIQFQKASEVLRQENDRLRREFVDIENSFVEYKAKYDSLLCLLKRQKGQVAYEENVVMKIKYLQWESHHKFLKEKNDDNEKIILELTSTLSKEMEANTRLIAQNEKLESELKELGKLKAVKVIKEEVIVVD